MGTWTFLTNHAHVLICISRDPGIRLKDIALQVGITERAAQRIVADLLRDGYLSRTRTGRRNLYELNRDLHFRHPLEQDNTISALIDALQPVNKSD